MDTDAAVLAMHQQELRRGTVVLAVLAHLRQPDYGYALLESLRATGVDVDANTLYPLLRRLDQQGLLTSAWDTETARPRKYYETSAAGRAVLATLASDWERLDAVLRPLLRQGEPA